jgi:predicted CoA-binding protein
VARAEEQFNAETRRAARSGSASHAAPLAVSADPIRVLLENAKVIAVVGLSSRHSRPSYGVARYLQSAGYRIIPVNPNETEVLGERAYARLEEVPEKIDMVDIFRRSEFVPDIVESAIRIGAHALWMQEGVIHNDAAERARRAGLIVVMDRCIMKDHHARFVA